MNKKVYLSLILWAISISITFAQPSEKYIKVVVSADHPDWIYKVGEKVKFTIAVYKNGSLLNNAQIRYEIGPEKQEPFEKETVVLPLGSKTIEGGTMTKGGFCVALPLQKSKEKSTETSVR